jgi:hypothetical protein
MLGGAIRPRKGIGSAEASWVRVQPLIRAPPKSPANYCTDNRANRLRDKYRRQTGKWLPKCVDGQNRGSV